MSSIVSTFVATSAAWVTVKVPWRIAGWTFRVSGGDMLMRGRLPGGMVALDNAAVLDNLDGTVTVAAAAHGVADGQYVWFPQKTSVNLANEAGYPVLAAGDTDNLVVTAEYVAETIATGKYAYAHKDITYPSGTEDAENEIVEAGDVLFYIKAVGADITLHLRATLSRR